MRHQIRIENYVIEGRIHKVVQGSTNVGPMMLDIPMEEEAWKGNINVLVVPMIGFDVILGLDWADNYLTTHFGKRIDQVLLENFDEFFRMFT